ncbi:proline--tRNA ligase [Iris pallida]|uniref:Proline--tRNA ligase n=1 Tax=Iris pallida TaxID=29817 RepID=A0AAX6EN20_IRIPA|nr:proline--tRNA ligase [Iris pallida]KAJ6816406.1 proline--tRNA ligase [Iris pallida]
MGYSKDQLLHRLKDLQINFLSYEHPVVLTVEAQAKYVGHLGGGLSKNLLLKDKKQRFYLISALAGTTIDLKVLSQRLGLGKGGLRMAPEEALQEILQVPLGCVTPLALINDSARTVSLLLDQGFRAKECCFFHPLSNDMTISFAPADLDKFLTSIGRKPSYVDLEANPVVGKDNPPDLADLVPSGAPTLPEQSEKEVTAQISVQNNVPEEKKATILKEGNSGPNHPKVTKEKSQSSLHHLAEATDVKKFVGELVDKVSAAVLSEIKAVAKGQQQELLDPSVLVAVRKRVTSDLENQTMILKNAAYTQGFHSGSKSALPQKYWNI